MGSLDRGILRGKLPRPSQQTLAHQQPLAHKTKRLRPLDEGPSPICAPLRCSNVDHSIVIASSGWMIRPSVSRELEVR